MVGTRFVHTSEGRFLITRLVPCPRCITNYIAEEDANLLVHPEESDDCKVQNNWSGTGSKTNESQVSF